ncbi:MAG: phosphoribosylanthranilate isomerase [Eubacteriales bacterium]|nr:phosphoribosylanthranilate isomerase [Eubacteriales bacterium]
MITPVEVKICGLTSEADAGLLAKYGADYGGIVMFYPKSKRNTEADIAGMIVDKLKKSDIKSVAVVVSPDMEQIDIIEKTGFDYVQIHGELKEEVYNRTGIPIIRAINIKDDDVSSVKESVEWCRRKDKITGLLLDAGVPGSGKIFDWNNVKDLQLSGKKIILAGGLTSDNVEEAIKTVKPDVVDVSSGVEYDDPLTKGKDENKVKTFIRNVRKR